jgi:hypothetical protein
MNCYYAQALVGGDAIGLYVEASDFDSAWDAAENKVETTYPRKESVVQALQLISIQTEQNQEPI